MHREANFENMKLDLLKKSTEMHSLVPRLPQFFCIGQTHVHFRYMYDSYICYPTSVLCRSSMKVTNFLDVLGVYLLPQSHSRFSFTCSHTTLAVVR